MAEETGSWKFGGVLAQGYYGIVMVWTHESHSPLAIKRFFEPKCPSSRVAHIKRCEEEVKRLLGLSHRNLVKAISLDQFGYNDLRQKLEAESQKFGGGVPVFPKTFLCMEYHPLGSLQQTLNQLENLSGLKEVDVRTILKDLCEGLKYLHDQAIAHRDIKPDNVLVKMEDNKSLCYQLSDLGLAKDLPELEKSFSTAVGTERYCPPEFKDGHTGSSTTTKRLTYKCDYWSLGVLALEVCFGQPRCIRNLVYKFGIQKQYEIPTSHHLSSFFLEHVQPWLQVMLEKDMEIRGNMPRHQSPRSVLGVIDILGVQPQLEEPNCLQWMLDFLNLPCAIISPKLSFAINDRTTFGSLQQVVCRMANIQNKENILIWLKQPDVILPPPLSDQTLKDLHPQVRISWIDIENPVDSRIFVPPRVAKLLRWDPATPSIHTDRKDVREIWLITVHYIEQEISRLMAHWAMVETLKILPGHGQESLCGELQRLRSEIPLLAMQIRDRISPASNTASSDSVEASREEFARHLGSTELNNMLRNLYYFSPEVHDPPGENFDKTRINSWWNDLKLQHDEFLRCYHTKDEQGLACNLLKLQIILGLFLKDKHTATQELETTLAFWLAKKLPVWVQVPFLKTLAQRVERLHLDVVSGKLLQRYTNHP